MRSVSAPVPRCYQVVARARLTPSHPRQALSRPDIGRRESDLAWVVHLPGSTRSDPTTTVPTFPRSTAEKHASRLRMGGPYRSEAEGSVPQPSRSRDGAAFPGDNLGIQYEPAGTPAPEDRNHAAPSSGNGRDAESFQAIQRLPLREPSQHFFKELLYASKHHGDISREPTLFRQCLERDLPICWRREQIRRQLVCFSSLKGQT